MSKKNTIEVEGVVVDALPNAIFKVKLDNGYEIIAHISGKLRMHNILRKFAKKDLVIAPFESFYGLLST